MFYKHKSISGLTVLAPVICAKVSWRRPPSLCWSSSTTLYVAPISLKTFFAILQYGHVVLENITTQLLDTTSCIKKRSRLINKNRCWRHKIYIRNQILIFLIKTADVIEIWRKVPGLLCLLFVGQKLCNISIW